LSAVVSVAAGSTGEIVPLTASQSVRVCSIVLSMTVTGTVQFSSGTGVTCGTGNFPLSGIMVMNTGIPLAVSAPASSALITGLPSNALCIAPVTGSVTGFISYAKF
jgi:hypothetical protein